MLGQLSRTNSLFRRGRLLCGAFALVLVAPDSAQAFYWYGWPGSGITEPPSLTPRPATEEVPSPNPSPFTPGFPGPPRTPFTPDNPHSPKEVPEPATLVIAGVGLGLVGLRKLLKSRK